MNNYKERGNQEMVVQKRKIQKQYMLRIIKECPELKALKLIAIIEQPFEKTFCSKKINNKNYLRYRECMVKKI